MISLDASRRDEAVHAGWAAYAERVPGMSEAYFQAASDWTVEAVCCGAEVIGALFSKDGVIHVGIVPAWRNRWASRRLIREMLKRGTKTQYMRGDDVSFLDRVRRIACHS